jgi:tRNA-binding protein
LRDLPSLAKDLFSLLYLYYLSTLFFTIYQIVQYCRYSGFPYTHPMQKEITWSEFESVELRVGTIIRAEDYPEARKPAYKIWVDFGSEIGIKQSSAQITVHYTREELIGKQIIGVVNFPVKQIGKFMSEFLCTGFYRED